MSLTFNEIRQYLLILLRHHFIIAIINFPCQLPTGMQITFNQTACSVFPFSHHRRRLSSHISPMLTVEDMRCFVKHYMSPDCLGNVVDPHIVHAQIIWYTSVDDVTKRPVHHHCAPTNELIYQRLPKSQSRMNNDAVNTIQILIHQFCLAKI